ncbi:MAG: T9SS type A sorting domain-containing protein [Bacteroidales bacterium]|nr:T9SS type A sorting domain-containing protein [Bacteroidales bacterium]
MKDYKIHLFFFFTFCINVAINGQLPNGVWRDHLPYSNARRIAEVNNKIFCSTTGGLFSYNKTDFALQKFSKVNGLGDIGITALNYNEGLQVLVIGYDNGNIDMIKNDSVINLPDIKRKLIIGDKAINNIQFINNYAYLACGFGIVVVDIQKNEFKDTYLFGPNGNQIFVNDIATDGEKIFASTNQGIISAYLNSPNLVDYNYWNKLSSLPDENAEYKSIAYFQGKLLAIYQNPLTSSSDIIEISKDSWKTWSPEPLNYRVINVHNNLLVLVSDYNSQVYDQSFNLVYQAATVLPQYAYYDKDGILWIADSQKGLMKSVNGVLSTDIYPNGPKYIDVGELVYSNGKLWVGSGNATNVYDNKGAYLFENEKWTNINRETLPPLEAFGSINNIAADPADPGHIFGGHTGLGVVEIKGDEVSVFDETNSVFKTIEGYGHGFIFVTGMSFDTENNLWVSTDYSENPVYVRRPDGSWENIKLKYDGFGSFTRIEDIYASKTGLIWLLMYRLGILVFRENADGSVSERFFTVINQEGELSERMHSIAEDNDGNIWIGTNSGPVIYYNPVSIIEQSGTIVGNQVIIPRNDGTNFGDPLLKNEKINCIKIDGANRKWMATEKSGVFLMSVDGKKEIHNFNSENSPLFSDNILSIEINDENGEVFFGTDKGILSFKGQATKGDDNYYDVYVYPNPVRESYRGDITITGLVANVNVKITDIAGNLVYETTALGGQAIWDGTNFRGDRVQTGVYMVFCTNDDGTKTHVTKLLFIH